MKGVRKIYVVRDYYYLKRIVVIFGLLILIASLIAYFITGYYFQFILMLVVLSLYIYFSYITKEGRFRRVLREITDEYDFEYANTGNSKYSYLIADNSVVLEIYSVFQNNSSTEMIVKEIVAIISKAFRERYFLVDYKVLDDRLKIEINRLEENRLIYDSYQKSDTDIRLSNKFVWNLKLAPMGLIVGPTGSGKTNFIKYLIFHFLSIKNENDIYAIDGKKGYLYYSILNFYNDKNCAYDTKSSISLLDRLNSLMNDRLKNLNDNSDYSEDMNYIEKFSDEGSILLVIDEALTLVTSMQNEDKQLKPAERQYNKFISLLSNLINKGRQANLHVVVAGQNIPASVIPTELRDLLGLRIALGRISRLQAIEVFSTYDVPDTEKEFSGVIWHDGLGWKYPKVFLQPYYDDKKLNFRKTLELISMDKKKSDTFQGEALETGLG